MSRPTEAASAPNPGDGVAIWWERSGRPGWICAALALITLAVFLPVLGHEFINFDDPDYVTENSRVLNGLTWNGTAWAFGSTGAGNWHPLTWLSLMLDAQIYGLHPAGFHLTNLVFHVGATLGAFLALFRLTGAPRRSALVAALFALHPLHVESVAWIAERKDVLSACGFFFCLWAYAHYVSARAQNSWAVAGGSARWYWLSLLFFTLGLLSKPMLVTVPFVLLLLDYWPLGRFAKDSKPVALVAEKTPFFAVSLVGSVVTFLAQKQGGSVVPLDVIPFGQRVANACVSYARYLGKTVWPDRLAVFYPYPGALAVWKVILSVALLVFITIAVLAMRRRNPAPLVGWLWFLGMLVPVIGLVQVGQQSMADRYSYLPLVGIFLLVGWAIPLDWLRRPPVQAAVVCVLLVLSLLTASQLRFWRNGETLFRHAKAVTEDNYVACHNLGSALARAGRWDEAAANFEAALKIKPRYPDAHYDLGIIAAERGRLPEAIEHYHRALELNPDFPEAHNNLGSILGQLGRHNEARQQLLLAVQLKPDFPEAHNNLANVEAALGNLNAAIAHYQFVVSLRPKHPQAWRNLGLAYDQQGCFRQAATNFARAAELERGSGDALVSLGIELAKLHQPEEAAAQFHRALALRPDDGGAKFHLANLLAEQGNLEAAARLYGEVLLKEPGHLDAHHNLAQVYAGQKQWSNALIHAEVTLRARTNDASAYLDVARALTGLGRYTESSAVLSNSLALDASSGLEYELGNVLLKAFRARDALWHYRAAQRMSPVSPQVWYQAGVALLTLGRPADAAVEWRSAIRMQPDWPEALNNLAWLEATSSDARIRNGTNALQLAQRALTLVRHAGAGELDTLAAAQAEAGDFAGAVESARRGANLADSLGQKSLANDIRKRLDLYQAGRPYREKAP